MRNLLVSVCRRLESDPNHSALNEGDLATFDMAEALLEAGEIEMAFKLQALQIRLITYPSQGEDREISLRALLKRRIQKFKSGVWEDIWEEQAKI